MYDDIIEELHDIRRRLIKEAGGTLKAYLKQVREYQNQHPEEFVDLSQKPIVPKAKSVQKPARLRTKAKPTARKPGQRRKAVATKG